MSQSPGPVIVSASRRTDIPAFYGEWFRRRLSEGACLIRNPFSGRQHFLSLLPEHVIAWVFWSRNYAPFLETLQSLHDAGARFVCHLTLTGLPSALEPHTPDPDQAIATAREIARRFGPQVLQWRYDPILFTSATPPNWHRQNFARLADALQGCAINCYFSFPTFYKKTVRNLRECAALRVFKREDLDGTVQADLLDAIARKAQQNGMTLRACCCPEWVAPEKGILPGHCVDWPLLQSLGAGSHLAHCDVPLHPSRKHCGCYHSRDIGAYQSCAHGCRYCYAVDHPDRAREMPGRHDPSVSDLADSFGA